jgi:hypothetical protein
MLVVNKSTFYKSTNCRQAYTELLINYLINYASDAKFLYRWLKVCDSALTSATINHYHTYSSVNNDLFVMCLFGTVSEQAIVVCSWRSNSRLADCQCHWNATVAVSVFIPIHVQFGRKQVLSRKCCRPVAKNECIRSTVVTPCVTVFGMRQFPI